MTGFMKGLVGLAAVSLSLFGLVGIYAAILRGLGLDEPFHMNEIHHEYIGAALVGLGWVLGWWPLAFLGVLLMVDDTWQHSMQTLDDPKYMSPIHQLYGYLYKLPPVRWLNTLADKLFHSI